MAGSASAVDGDPAKGTRVSFEIAFDVRTFSLLGEKDETLLLRPCQKETTRASYKLETLRVDTHRKPRQQFT